MAMLILASLPPWPHRVDRGVLLLVAALFLVTILAHRYWRATIRLEDEALARGLEAERALERYRVQFRTSPHPAAFADRATGLVMEAAPGWVQAGLPLGGAALFEGDPDLEAAWRAIPGPDAEHRPAQAVELVIRQRPFRAEPLGGPSLGIILVVAK
jgi:hypothetical protein